MIKLRWNPSKRTWTAPIAIPFKQSATFFFRITTSIGSCWVPWTITTSKGIWKGFEKLLKIVVSMFDSLTCKNNNKKNEPTCIYFFCFEENNRFSNFSCRFLNPNIFFQEKVKKAFWNQKFFRPLTVGINCSSDLKIFANSWPSASNLQSFSRSLVH